MGHKWENIDKQKYALIKFGVVEYKDNILGSKTVPTVFYVLDKPVYWSKIMHTIKIERY